jgi:hypothetical protein
MRTAVLGVRFLLELAMLAALVYAGVALVAGPAGWLVGLVLAAVAALAWGLFVSPRARYGTPTAARLAIEVALFAAAAAGLLLAGRPGLAGVLGALYVAHRIALWAAGAPPFEPPPS